jgi:hypothetical protein
MLIEDNQKYIEHISPFKVITLDDIINNKYLEDDIIQSNMKDEEEKQKKKSSIRLL